MQSFDRAERILRRVIGPERAAALIGDLAEQGQTGQPWLTVATVLVAELWRWPVAFVAAAYAGVWVGNGYNYAIFGPPMDSPHRPGLAYGFALMLLSFAATMLWMTTVFSLIQVGPHSRLVRLALPLAALATALIYLSWLPWVVSGLILLMLIVLDIGILNRQYRSALFGISVIKLAGLAAFAGTFYLDDLYRRHLIPGQVGTAELQMHPSIGWLQTFNYLLSVAVLAMITTSVNRRLSNGTGQMRLTHSG